MCVSVSVDWFVFVWRGVAGGTEFLVRNHFLFWEYLCVILCELNCKLLCCSETVFCIMSLEGRASLDGGTSLEGKILLEDRTLLEDRVPGGQTWREERVPGGQDFIGVHSELYIL